MNRLADGTGWILPPRCASRYTAGLLWKYGLMHFAEHALDPEINVQKICMNIRNPTSRFRSFYRLVNSRWSACASFDDYVMNLITAEHGCQFSNDVGEDIPADEPWIYPIPLVRYLDILAQFGKRVDHFIHVESLEADLERAGYPIRDHKMAMPVEYDIDANHHDFEIMNDPMYLRLMADVYGRDYEELQYVPITSS